jgi:hypothetical protein
MAHEVEVLAHGNRFFLGRAILPVNDSGHGLIA